MFGMPTVPFIDDAGDNGTKGRQVRGFGFLHDGSVDTVFRFLTPPCSTLPPSDTRAPQLEEFMLAFDSNLAPIVGQQMTLTNANGGVDARCTARLEPVRSARRGRTSATSSSRATSAASSAAGVRLPSGKFRSDRASEPTLTAGAAARCSPITAGQELTYTCVPPGSGERMGVDRDEDGFFDRDEIDAGSDPADPLAIPGGTTASPRHRQEAADQEQAPRRRVEEQDRLLSKDRPASPPRRRAAPTIRAATPIRRGTVKATLTLVERHLGPDRTPPTCPARTGRCSAAPPTRRATSTPIRSSTTAPPRR